MNGWVALLAGAAAIVAAAVGILWAAGRFDLDAALGDALDGAELPDADYPTSNVRWIAASEAPESTQPIATTTHPRDLAGVIDAHIDAMWSAAYGDSGVDPTPCGYCIGLGVRMDHWRDGRRVHTDYTRCPRCGGTGNEPGAA